MTDELHGRREQRDRDEARRIAAEYLPWVDRAYRRAVEREKAKCDPRNHPPIACTSEAIDAGMFHMEHGHYPDEPPTPYCECPVGAALARSERP